jgi:hypothetical protein
VEKYLWKPEPRDNSLWNLVRLQHTHFPHTSCYINRAPVLWWQMTADSSKVQAISEEETWGSPKATGETKARALEKREGTGVHSYGH